MISKRDELYKLMSDKQSDNRIVYLAVGADTNLKIAYPRMLDLQFSHSIKDKSLRLPTVKAKRDADIYQGYEHETEDYEIYYEIEKRAIKIAEKEVSLSDVASYVEIIICSYTYEDIDCLMKENIIARSELIPSEYLYYLKVPKNIIPSDKLTIQPYLEIAHTEFDSEGSLMLYHSLVQNTIIGRCTFFAISPAVVSEDIIYSKYLAWDRKSKRLYPHKDYAPIKKKCKNMKRMIKLARYVDVLFTNKSRLVTPKMFKDTEQNSIKSGISEIRKLLKEDLGLSEKQTNESIITIKSKGYILE